MSNALNISADDLKGLQAALKNELDIPDSAKPVRDRRNPDAEVNNYRWTDIVEIEGAHSSRVTYDDGNTSWRVTLAVRFSSDGLGNNTDQKKYVDIPVNETALEGGKEARGYWTAKNNLSVLAVLVQASVGLESDFDDTIRAMAFPEEDSPDVSTLVGSKVWMDFEYRPKRIKVGDEWIDGDKKVIVPRNFLTV